MKFPNGEKGSIYVKFARISRLVIKNAGLLTCNEQLKDQNGNKAPKQEPYISNA